MPKKKKKLAAATIGNINEHRCIKYVLQNYHIYGVQPTLTFKDAKGKMVIKSHNIEKTRMYGDLFSVPYKDEYGNWQKAGWDIMTIPQSDEVKTAGGMVKLNIYLIQSKTNFNVLSNIRYLRALCELKVPSYVKKQLFNWKSGQDEPEITNL